MPIFIGRIEKSHTILDNYSCNKKERIIAVYFGSIIIATIF